MIETEEYKKAFHEWVVSGDAIDLVPILVEEVKRLRKKNEFHMMLDREKTKEDLKVYEENDKLTKLCIERYAEIKRLREGIKEVMNECVTYISNGWPNATTMMKKLTELIE